MATGSYDSNGVWQYGEDDNISLFSSLLNTGQTSVSNQFTADRSRLSTLEAANTALGRVSWTSYTPTYTNLTVGNGTVVAAYARVNNTVFVRFKITFGSTTSITVGGLAISVPVNINSAYTTAAGGNVGFGNATDTGVASYALQVRPESTSTVRPLAQNASGTYLTTVGVSSSVPHTWGTGDVLEFQLIYQAA